MDKAAKEYLTDLMLSVRGNIMKAALIADYDRPHFYKLLQRHGLDYHEFRAAAPSWRSNEVRC